MSDNLPPERPPGAPGQPPVEHLQVGGGQPLDRAPRQGSKRRIALVTGGVVLTAAVVGGGAWAWNAYFNQGPQPAEALPGNTLAYVAIDLDPSGEQKVEAIRTLRKFPAFKDEVGLDTDDDVREKIFEEIQEEGACQDLDYGDDVESWLGERFAFAIVDRDGETPAPVVVVQVKDQDAAEEGLDKIVECTQGETGSEEELGGYAFNGDWVILAETEEIAKDVANDADGDALSEDGDYERWTEAAGDSGFLTMYAAPEAGAALVEFAEENPMFFGGYSQGEAESSDFGTSEVEPSAYSGAADDEIPDELKQALEDFPGGAAVLRAQDGGFELELVTGQISDAWGTLAGNGRGGEMVATLPDTTAAAFGIGFDEGWAADLLEQLTPLIEAESGMPAEQAIAELEAQTGLSIPEDVETLGGESFAIAVDSDIDPSAFEDEDISRIPVGIKVKGDPEAIEAVLDKLRAQAGPQAGELLLSRTVGDDVVVISGSEDYLDQLAEDGDLGGNDTFESLVPNREDASSLLFVNVDAGDDWLVRLMEDTGAPEELVENVEPFEGLGISGWKDGDEVHGLLKLTTE